MGFPRSVDLSVIIPVLNEEEGIHDSISRLQALAGDRCIELIIVDGDPAGSTIQAIPDGTVTKLIAERGRARQMNAGASLASGTVLLFLHADSILPKNAFQLILSAIHDARINAGVFDLGVASERAVFRITERYVAVRTRLTRIPFGDQAIFLRRDYFNALDGFSDIPLMEDVDLMKRIKKRGDRIAIIPEKVLTSARRWEREGILYCTCRNWLLQILYSLGVSPMWLARWYRF
jgi:rSAM/selenodomain-associated transferase 2